MGNCHSNGGKFNKSPLKEENLIAVPGRIFSNDAGRSRSSSSVSSIFTQQGRKGVNQDAMLLWEDFGTDDNILCGVFDGHGPHGHLVARKVRDALPLKLMSLLTARDEARSGCMSRPRVKKDLVLNGEMVYREAFAKAYKAMDKDLRSHPTLDCFCSGSTAVILLRVGKDLFMANIGDSRAILGTRDGGGELVAVQLTVDLKPDLPRESERIKKCKGRVFALQDEPQVPRVWLPFDDAPGLAMARAFGDFCLKDYGVISVPEFFHWTLTDSDQFVVLASDGVWDVLTNKEVIDIVASSPSRSSAAKFLVDAAAREWKLKYPTSKMDDCAVVCLYLNKTTQPESTSVEITTCDPCTENIEDASNQEPTLDRNFTVRSSIGSSTIPIVCEESGSCSTAEDQTWSGLDGMTRVNSIVQLPRFFDEKTSS